MLFFKVIFVGGDRFFFSDVVIVLVISGNFFREMIFEVSFWVIRIVYLYC